MVRFKRFRDLQILRAAREKVIGWYHSGPKLRGSDLSINRLLRSFIPNPILVVVHINSVDPTQGIPTDAYFAIEEIKDDGTTTAETFVHIPSTIEAEEAEEIGVEHLLRDLKESSGDLATRITSQLESLRGLQSRLREVAAYLGKVLAGELPVNHAILEVLQDVFNLLPNLSPTPVGGSGGVGDLERSFRVKTNDQLMCIYLSSMIRAVLALHDLIDSGIDGSTSKEETKEEKKDEKKGDKKEEAEKKSGVDKKMNGVAEDKKPNNAK
jgi:26S proteasome regulatory subunit N8